VPFLVGHSPCTASYIYRRGGKAEGIMESFCNRHELFFYLLKEHVVVPFYLVLPLILAVSFSFMCFSSIPTTNG
jgi:hypothetical protein